MSGIEEWQGSRQDGGRLQHGIDGIIGLELRRLKISTDVKWYGRAFTHSLTSFNGNVAHVERESEIVPTESL